MLHSASPLKPTPELMHIKLLLTDKDLFVKQKWISTAAVFNTGAPLKQPGSFHQKSICLSSTPIDSDSINL